MSNQQGNPKLRRNGSPSIKQGPIRATQQFGLASPSRVPVRRSPNSSPVPKDNHCGIGKNKCHPLSDTGHLNDRRSPSSPSGFRIVEKSGAILSGRSNSFDNVMAAPYLSGQWPKDGHWQTQTKDLGLQFPPVASSFISDKQTQTPSDWEEPHDRRRSSKLNKSRSQSVGSGDQKLKNIKHKLQRNGGLPSGSPSLQHRLSPVCAINTLGTNTPTSVPIKIPASSSTGGVFVAPRGTPGKARGSVEGFSQEVEKLIIAGGVLPTADISLADNPDGHRAPICELLSQTSNLVTGGDSLSYTAPVMLEVKDNYECSDNSRCSSQSDEEISSRSASPSFIPEQFELEDPGTTENNDDINGALLKMTSSPRPNSEFMRQPPDGAEKIKIIDELTIVPKFSEFCLIAPSKTFQPSATSAFQYLKVYRQSIDTAHAQVVDDAH